MKIIKMEINEKDILDCLNASSLIGLTPDILALELLPPNHKDYSDWLIAKVRITMKLLAMRKLDIVRREGDVWFSKEAFLKKCGERGLDQPHEVTNNFFARSPMTSMKKLKFLRRYFAHPWIYRVFQLTKKFFKRLLFKQGKIRVWKSRLKSLEDFD